jgi:hypothetical protein
MHKEAFRAERLEGAIEIKRFLEDDLFTKKLKINEAAKKLNVSAERLYKYLNPNSHNNNFPVFLLPLYTAMIGPELLWYLATESEYGIVKIPAGNGDIRAAVQAASEAMRECSEALEVFLTAVDDDRVSLRELKAIKQQTTEAIETLLRLFDSCRQCSEGQRINCRGVRTPGPPLRTLLPLTLADIMPQRRHEIADDVMRFRKMIDDHRMGRIIILNFH